MLRWLLETIRDLLIGAAAERDLERAGVEGPRATVSVAIGATGFDRQAEEELARSRIVGFCRAHLADEYSFGAECDPSGPACRAWDCSELTQNAYNRAGLEYPDGANYQRAFCRGRRIREPKPGDPFFFDPDEEGIGHTGVYAGDGMIIEARSHRTQGRQDGRVHLSPRWDIEAHPRFAGWFRHPDLAYSMGERA